MRSQVFVAALVLAIPLVDAGTAAQGRMRFAAMDSNRDGRITQHEWRGSARSFQVHDWDGDGVLSGDEVRVGARRNRAEQEFDPDQLTLRDWSPDRFRAIDRNRDARITRAEWFYDAEGFVRADRNRDGVLTRSEFLGGDVDDDREDAFADVDHDRNGRIERSEWHGSAEAFEWLDRDRDDVLTRSEVAGESVPRHESDLFGSLDANRNGVIDRREWQWSRVSFDGRDRNNDGALSREELGAASSGTAGAGQEPIGTSGRAIVVDARERWTDTGLVVRRGDMLRFEAEGTIQMSSAGADTATASGSSSGRLAPNSPVSSHPAGGLIARIGDSAPVYVGDRTTRLRAPVGGRLYLGVNDDHLADNSGEFRVSITIQR
jgi:Ca2+-binding EF-hand superfamily protein